MAKGFTVKAKAPVAEKKADWDYDAIKDRMRGKKIVFCLPGRGCSYTFLKNFVQMCFDLVQNQMSIQISHRTTSSMVNFARCKCLGCECTCVVPSKYLGMVSWSMIINCGLIMTLCLTRRSSGNSVIWHFLRKQSNEDDTVDQSKLRAITSGWYSTEDGKTTSVAHWLEEDDFKNNGGVMNHETIESISKRRQSLYSGLHWFWLGIDSERCL